MTKAEKITNSGKVPAALQDAATDVLAAVDRAHASMDDDRQPMVQHEGEVMTLLHFRYKTQGLHAYRYEEMDDGSALALWANEPGSLQLKSFANMAEAAKWSPRDERDN